MRGGRLLAMAAGLALGCAYGRLPYAGTDAPKRHVVRCSQYAFTTDFPFDAEHELARDLLGLRDTVFGTLALPPGRTVVRVAVFDDEARYGRFLKDNFPELPARRAFFIQHGPEELVVYAWRGGQLRADLRHEATHALLHSVLPTVPMWLDEGLAEHFEIGPERAAGNPRHVAGLRAALAQGWRPNLARLEGCGELRDMGAAEYRESWLWVHFCLHGPPPARAALLAHLQELRASPTAPRPVPSLATRLAAAVPEAAAAVERHLLALETAPETPRGGDYPYRHPAWWRQAFKTVAR